MRSNHLTLILIALQLAAPADGIAATVKAVRSTKVMLELDEGETVAVGDLLSVKAADATKHAVLAITATKGRQALAEIRSGEVVVGNIATADGKLPEREKKAAANAETKPPGDPSMGNWNLAFGGSSDSQIVKLTAQSQVNLSGFSVMGRFSRARPAGTTGHPFFERLAWEYGGGLEMLSTKGTLSSGSCKGTNNCHFEIISLTGFGRAGLILARGMDLQLRAGADMLVPLSVSSNVIDYSTFQPLAVLVGGISMRFRAKGDRTVPVAIEYGTYVGNSDVTLNRIMLLVGYSWP